MIEAPVFGSLFSGIGGLDLGLEQAGWRPSFQVEINPYARRVLEHYWPGLPRWDDATTFPDGDLERWRCDLIVGGDPCQENSKARVTAGTRAPSLGAEFIRIVSILRPQLVLRENPTRVREDAPWPWWRFRDELTDLGYLVLPFRLRSCCVGAEHQRDRLFLLAQSTDSIGHPLRLQGCGEAAEAAPGMQGAPREWERVRTNTRPVGGCAWCRADIDIGRRDDGVPSRVDRLRALGNAVDVRVAEYIGRTLLDALRS